jgi:hypothetical protein
VSRRFLLVQTACAVMGRAASAEPVRAIVDTPIEKYAASPAATSESPVIYLNRCIGGCTIEGAGKNDARANQSSIIASGTHTLGEFANQFGQTTTTPTHGTCLDPTGSVTTTTCNVDADCQVLGAGSICDSADYEWNIVVKCLTEVYSPYAVTLTEQRPTDGSSYTMALIAGLSSDIGQPDTVIGIAPLATDCSAQNNVIAFTLANSHPPVARTDNICWTAAQETAHAFGLDHEYEYLDGTSACNDPMTYRNDCGGEKFFRNKEAKCGGPGDGFGPAPRACRCTQTQNSHRKLTNVFGPGESIIPAPTASISFPLAGATVGDNWNTEVSSGSRRGVDRVELWINGWPWLSKPGADFTPAGQPNPSSYSLVAPNGVPGGGIKAIVKSFDDIGLEGDASILLKKGPACTADTNCLDHQHCNTGAETDTVAAGGCYWDPGTGQVGDACGYPQFCESRLCLGPSGGEVCTQTCSPSDPSSCPSGFECDIASDNMSYCFAKASGGCCSTSNGPVWPSVGLSALVLGLVTRRRRCAA